MTTKAWAIVVALLLIASMGLLVLHYHAAVTAAEERVRQQDQELALSKQVNDQLISETTKFNSIADDIQQQQLTTVAKSEERQIEYRTIIKTEPCSAQYVPDAIAQRLLDYTHSLRASAVHTPAIVTDGTGAGTATSDRLTYAQAVLWLDPLLSTIEQANTQLAGIREAEAARGGVTERKP